MRLPEAVSRLAAPFFGSQAEPSSRQRGMFRANGSICLAFGETHISVYSVLRRCCLTYAWCHCGIPSDQELNSPFTPHG